MPVCREKVARSERALGMIAVKLKNLDLSG